MFRVNSSFFINIELLYEIFVYLLSHDDSGDTVEHFHHDSSDHDYHLVQPESEEQETTLKHCEIDAGHDLLQKIHSPELYCSSTKSIDSFLSNERACQSPQINLDDPCIFSDEEVEEHIDENSQRRLPA